ncbi:hypothetical protein [Arthrobacter sp. KK5.5]|uniref:hypothetical protein n=1 Tax=Arthrobacter sp. KK5.5 TaxID=3373084 RepID=UPI003EE435CF
MSREGIAVEFHYGYVSGQTNNGYRAKRTIMKLDAALRSISDGSIQDADTAFWDDPSEHNSGGK